MAFNLQEARSCSEIPACRGAEVLALLIDVNPIQKPELQRYRARVEFVEAAVERMFNADEVTSIVDVAKLECLKRKIVSLFFTQ